MLPVETGSAGGKEPPRQLFNWTALWCAACLAVEFLVTSDVVRHNDTLQSPGADTLLLLLAFCLSGLVLLLWVPSFDQLVLRGVEFIVAALIVTASGHKALPNPISAALLTRVLFRVVALAAHSLLPKAAGTPFLRLAAGHKVIVASSRDLTSQPTGETDMQSYPAASGQSDGSPSTQHVLEAVLALISQQTNVASGNRNTGLAPGSESSRTVSSGILGVDVASASTPHQFDTMSEEQLAHQTSELFRLLQLSQGTAPPANRSYKPVSRTKMASVKVQCNDAKYSQVTAALLTSTAPAVAGQLAGGVGGATVVRAACFYGCVEVLVWVRQLLACHVGTPEQANGTSAAMLGPQVIFSLEGLQHEVGQVQVRMAGHSWTPQTADAEAVLMAARPQPRCTSISPLCFTTGQHCSMQATLQIPEGQAPMSIRVLLLDVEGELVHDVAAAACELLPGGLHAVRFEAPPMAAGIVNMLMLCERPDCVWHMLLPVLCCAPATALQLQGLLGDVEMKVSSPSSPWQDSIQGLCADIAFLLEGRDQVVGALRRLAPGCLMAHAEVQPAHSMAGDTAPGAADRECDEQLAATLMSVLQHLAERNQWLVFKELIGWILRGAPSAASAATEPMTGTAAHQQLPPAVLRTMLATQEHVGEPMCWTGAARVGVTARIMPAGSGCAKVACGAGQEPAAVSQVHQPMWHAAVFGFQDESLEAAYEVMVASSCRLSDQIFFIVQVLSSGSTVLRAMRQGLSMQLSASTAMRVICTATFAALAAVHGSRLQGRCLYVWRMNIIQVGEVCMLALQWAMLQYRLPLTGAIFNAMVRDSLMWDCASVFIRPLVFQMRPHRFIVQLFSQALLAAIRWRHLPHRSPLVVLAYDFAGIYFATLAVALLLEAHNRQMLCMHSKCPGAGTVQPNAKHEGWAQQQQELRIQKKLS